jgi:hypothetical protein
LSPTEPCCIGKTESIVPGLAGFIRLGHCSQTCPTVTPA